MTVQLIGYLQGTNRKAMVIHDDDGSAILISYETPVLKVDIDGTPHRLWDSWSATTGRHIKQFCGITKRDWDKLPVEDL